MRPTIHEETPSYVYILMPISFIWYPIRILQQQVRTLAADLIIQGGEQLSSADCHLASDRL